MNCRQAEVEFTQSTEELLNTTDLLRTNKRVSNKIAPAGPPKIQSNKNTKMGNQTDSQNQNRKPL
jgi:hypothetical protein